MTEIALDVGTPTVSVELPQSVNIGMETGQYMPTRPKGIDYKGSYEVTPSSAEQVLPTRGRLMSDDLVINPIPSNYGLITYSGGILTVS